jgi:hypothetical protein
MDTEVMGCCVGMVGRKEEVGVLIADEGEGP